MSVSYLDPNNRITPATWVYYFDTEDEAQMFLAGVREDLANEELIDLVDHDVMYAEYAGAWRLTVDVVDRNPVDPDDTAEPGWAGYSNPDEAA